MTVQLKTQKKTSRTASEGGRNNGIIMFGARGSILRGVNDNMLFTVINLKKFKHTLYFSTLDYVGGPNVITRILLRGKQVRESQMRVKAEVGLTFFADGGRVTSPGLQAASRSWKGQGEDIPTEPS